MARRTFALERGGEKRLDLNWSGIWKNVEVRLDGQVLGEPIPNFAALREGREYPLPDGRTLEVRFDQKVGGGGLTLSVEGRPLPGTSDDPNQAIKTAAVILWVVAALNAILGVVVTSLLGGGGIAFALPIAIGVVLAVLAYLVQTRQSKVALLIAIIIEVLDTIAALVMMAESGRVSGGIIIRAFIIIALVRAYQAVADAKRLQRDELVDTFR